MTALTKLFTLAAVGAAVEYRRRNRKLTVALARKEASIQVFAGLARDQITAHIAEWEDEMGRAA